MSSTENNDHRLAEFPALAALRLTAGDWEALAGQGFVGEERRGRRTYFKLRFRRAGNQVVRYLGSADRAALVQEELDLLQSETKLLKQLNARVKIANKMLRDAKRTLEPLLEANGFVFHGLAIRRPRQRSHSNHH